MSVHAESVPQLVKMLRNLASWLDEGAAWAETRGFDVDVLLQARLFPDMFPLVRQVQAACDSAKFVGSRLSGHDAPLHPDTEATLDELRARIDEVVAYLEGLPAEAFDGDRLLSLPFLPEHHVRGVDYLREFALPNFYFHATTAYAILRHCGVTLGKRTFIGGMTLVPKA